jgi:hypothetical protein
MAVALKAKDTHSLTHTHTHFFITDFTTGEGLWQWR